MLWWCKNLSRQRQQKWSIGLRLCSLGSFWSTVTIFKSVGILVGTYILYFPLINTKLVCLIRVNRYSTSTFFQSKIRKILIFGSCWCVMKCIKASNPSKASKQSANTVIQRYVAGMVLSLRNVSLLPLQLTHVVLLLFFQSTNFQCTNVGGTPAV